MVKDFLSTEFIEALEAKGVHPKQFLIRLCKMLEWLAKANDIWNQEHNFNFSKVVDLPVDFKNFPIIEAELAARVKVSRHTIEDWRRKGLLKDTYYETKGGRFYFYYPALKAIKLILTDSPRSALISEEIFNNVD